MIHRLPFCLIQNSFQKQRYNKLTRFYQKYSEFFDDIAPREVTDMLVYLQVYKSEYVTSESNADQFFQY